MNLSFRFLMCNKPLRLLLSIPLLNLSSEKHEHRRVTELYSVPQGCFVGVVSLTPTGNLPFMNLKMTLIYIKINLQVEQITLVSHEDSFWHRGKGKLTSSPLVFIRGIEQIRILDKGLELTNANAKAGIVSNVNVIIIGIFAVAFPQSGSSSTVSRSNWNLEVLIFEEGGKPENPEKNSRSKEEN